MKSLGTEGWYQIAPRLSRLIRITLPKKISRWKGIFFCCRIPRGLQLSGFWKPERIIEGTGLSSPKGFEVLNVPHVNRINFDEVDIPRGGEADYHWADEPVPVVRNFLGRPVAGRSAQGAEAETRAPASSEDTPDIGSEREEPQPVQSPLQEGGEIELLSSSESTPPEQVAESHQAAEQGMWVVQKARAAEAGSPDGRPQKRHRVDGAGRLMLSQR